MNKGFIKLEIILAGVILLGVAGFLATKDLNLLTSKEDLLKQRYSKFTSLIDSKNYSEAYNGFYSADSKNKLKKEEFVKGNTENTGKVFKSTYQVNNVVIEDNIGYIDRSLTQCLNSDCTSKNVLRGYKKWIYQDNNWYSTLESPNCIRTKMYDTQPEFERAISLLKQRLTDGYKNSDNPPDLSFFNCLDIQYGDVGNAEGMFTFNKATSNIDKLVIKVNQSYKSSDDLLTAFLLAHETLHATNYVKMITTGVETLCVTDESNAFGSQLVFAGFLNTGELESLNTRLRQGYPTANNTLKMAWNLLMIENQAKQFCRTNQMDKCAWSEVDVLLENMVRSNPYYQKQCNL